jgi:DnaJ-class molecular chaperone
MIEEDDSEIAEPAPVAGEQWEWNPCPVCGGTGAYDNPLAADSLPEVCRLCHGSGQVVARASAPAEAS